MLLNSRFTVLLAAASAVAVGLSAGAASAVTTGFQQAGAGPYDYNTATNWAISQQAEPFSPSTLPGAIPVHGGVINTSFPDGHVDSINSIQTFTQAVQPLNMLR